MTSTPNYTRTDLRTLADRARDVTWREAATNPTLAAQAEAVEAVLRVLTGDAPGDALTAAVTAGGIPDVSIWPGRTSTNA
jgi:hypothetical protein